MSATSLLDTLRRRGVELIAEGGRLRWRAPQGAVTPTVRAALQRSKEELLELLSRDLPDVDAAPVLEARLGVGAVLIASPRYGETWVALDARTAAELVAEERARREPRPVLIAEEVALLRGKSEEAVRSALEIARAFPGARILQ